MLRDEEEDQDGICTCASGKTANVPRSCVRASQLRRRIIADVLAHCNST